MNKCLAVYFNEVCITHQPSSRIGTRRYARVYRIWQGATDWRSSCRLKFVTMTTYLSVQSKCPRQTRYPLHMQTSGVCLWISESKSINYIII